VRLLSEFIKLLKDRLNKLINQSINILSEPISGLYFNSRWIVIVPYLGQIGCLCSGAAACCKVTFTY